MSETHPPLPKDDATTIEKAIQKVRFDAVENLYIFKNGKQKRRFRGTSKQVYPPQEFLFEMKDATIIHNHPSGSSFSVEDIKSIVEQNAKIFHLVTENYLYTLTRPPDGWNILFDEDKTYQIINISHELANQLIDKMISKNELTFFEKDKELFHYLWSSFFNIYGISYQKSAL